MKKLFLISLTLLISFCYQTEAATGGKDSADNILPPISRTTPNISFEDL